MHSKRELEKLDQQWVERSESHRIAGRREMCGVIAWVAMMAGFALVFLGLWLNKLGEDVRLERLLYPWPIVAMVLGVCVVLGSVGFMVRNARYLRQYYHEKIKYESQRHELMQEIYSSDSD